MFRVRVALVVVVSLFGASACGSNAPAPAPAATEPAPAPAPAPQPEARSVTGKALVTDVRLDDNFVKSVRNIAGIRLVASGRVTARDVMDTTRIVATKAAVERWQEVLG